MQTSPSVTPFYTAETYKPEESIGYLMRQILTTVARDIEHELAHTELTNAQWIPIYKLFMGQASTVAELARHCQTDTGAMTRTLDRLEAKNLCVRKRSHHDRRVVNIVLTEAGRQAASQLPSVISAVQNVHLSGFSQEEFEMLKHFLNRILRNAQNSPREKHAE